MASKADAFDVGDYVVYPKHGVGRVIELQREEIAGMQLELYVLRFEKERMTLRVPTNKVEAIGMRKLSSDKTLPDAMETPKANPPLNPTSPIRSARSSRPPRADSPASWRRWKRPTSRPRWRRFSQCCANTRRSITTPPKKPDRPKADGHRRRGRPARGGPFRMACRGSPGVLCL